MCIFLWRLFLGCIILSVCVPAFTYEDNPNPFIEVPYRFNFSPTIIPFEFEQGFANMPLSEDLGILNSNFFSAEEPEAEELNREVLYYTIEAMDRPFLLYNAEEFLNTPTYDGSGQAMHPDIAYFSQGWNGYKYWMAMTPYPGSRRSYENASVLVSNDGYSWSVPPGLKNPIIEPIFHKGNNADTDLVYQPQTDELWIYYVCFKDRLSSLYRVKSKDGIIWTDRELILQEPGFGIISPSIVYKDGIYHFWYVDAGSHGINAGSTIVKYRSSPDGINWSGSEVVDIKIEGRSVWHLDVIYVPVYDEYWMLFPAYGSGVNANRTSLFFARAKQPLGSWLTFSNPVLERGSRESWDSSRIYRASFIYDDLNNKIRVWYSAAKKRYWPIPTIYDWFTGYTEANYIPQDYLIELAVESASVD